jgi:hypothetical protein
MIRPDSLAPQHVCYTAEFVLHTLYSKHLAVQQVKQADFATLVNCFCGLIEGSVAKPKLRWVRLIDTACRLLPHVPGHLLQHAAQLLQPEVLYPHVACVVSAMTYNVGSYHILTCLRQEACV